MEGRSVLGDHAVVLGAGMAGLLAASVLSECYRTVTVVERDSLPTKPIQRRGIPQGRHLHGLLSRGSQALEQLMPGILHELATAGAQVLNDGDHSRVNTRVDGLGLNRRGKFSDPAALVTYQISRPGLEFQLRSRVGLLENVTVLDGHDAAELTAATPDRVTGVRVTDRGTKVTTTLSADVVVDAMGRAARTPAFLEALGYGRPPERRSMARATYFSQFVALPDVEFAERYVLVQPGPARPIAGLIAYENDSWVFTVGGHAAADAKPTDLGEMLDLAEGVLPGHILAGLRAADPVGDVAVFRYPGAVWRRFDQMARFPRGLFVIGDALCSLNPSFGQGMTLAALEVLTLRDHLRSDAVDDAQLFFGAAAAHIGPVWAMNEASGGAANYVDDERRRSVAKRLLEWGRKRTLVVAANDIVLTERLLRVANLVDPPSRLRDPALLRRVILGSLFGSRAA